MAYPNSIKKLIDNFAKLPGIGVKTAERLALFLSKQDKRQILQMAESLQNLAKNINVCSLCGKLTNNNLCEICSNKQRDANTICVVAEDSELEAIEGAANYNGHYHLLHGYLIPTEGKTADKLNINNLVERVKKDKVKEVILAFDPTIEGETTILYLKKTLSDLPVKITRLARGLPQGSDLEYADQVTLSNAFKGRTNL